MTLFLFIKSYGQRNYTMVEEPGEDRLHHKIALRSLNNIFLENLVVKLLRETDNFTSFELK